MTGAATPPTRVARALRWAEITAQMGFNYWRPPPGLSCVRPHTMRGLPLDLRRLENGGRGHGLPVSSWGARPWPATGWMRSGRRLRPTQTGHPRGERRSASTKGKWYAPPSYGRSRRARPVRCPDAARRPSSRTPPVGLVELSPFACLCFTSSTTHPTSIPTTTPPAVRTPQSPFPSKVHRYSQLAGEKKGDRLDLQGGDLEVRASLGDHPVIMDTLQERVNPAAPLLASAALLLHRYVFEGMRLCSCTVHVTANYTISFLSTWCVTSVAFSSLHFSGDLI